MEGSGQAMFGRGERLVLSGATGSKCTHCLEPNRSPLPAAKHCSSPATFLKRYLHAGEKDCWHPSNTSMDGRGRLGGVR